MYIAIPKGTVLSVALTGNSINLFFSSAIFVPDLLPFEYDQLLKPRQEKRRLIS